MRINRVWPLAMQYGGAAVAAAGLYGLVGLLWTALVVGAAGVVVGTLAELKGGQ